MRYVQNLVVKDKDGKRVPMQKTSFKIEGNKSKYEIILDILDTLGSGRHEIDFAISTTP